MISAEQTALGEIDCGARKSRTDANNNQIASPREPECGVPEFDQREEAPLGRIQRLSVVHDDEGEGPAMMGRNSYARMGIGVESSISFSSTRGIESSAARLDAAARTSMQTARSNLLAVDGSRNIAGEFCLTRAARAPFIGSAR